MQLLALWQVRRALVVRPPGRGARHGRRHENAYAWGSKGIDFNHCRRCGCVVCYQRRRPNSEGQVRVGINTCMVPAADLDGIRVRRLDGAGNWAYLD